MSIDDYILGAIMLYVDIIKIFLRILKLLEKLDNDKKKKWCFVQYIIKILFFKDFVFYIMILAILCFNQNETLSNMHFLSYLTLFFFILKFLSEW